MQGSDFVGSLPSSAGPERECLIFQAVRERQIYVDWTNLTVESGGHKLVLVVSCNALAVGDQEDHVRVAVWASTMQLIADELGCIMPTARLSDLIYLQSVNKLSVHTQSPDSHMADTSRFVSHSRIIDTELGGRSGLSAPEGKDFVLCNALWFKLGYAANYGWQTRSGRYVGVTSGVRLCQPLADRIDPATKKPTLPHGVDYTDYSQFVRLVRREAILDGQKIDLADLYVDPHLSALVSHEGALKGFRYPTVNQGSDPTIKGPEIPEITDKRPTLRYGDRDQLHGGWVERWQLALIERGYSLGAAGADGVFLANTLKQTKSYQRSRYDIPLAVDGVVGPATWGSLDTHTPVPDQKSAPRAVHGPPRPNFLPLPTVAAKQALFGAFEYREIGDSNDSIQILGNWSKDNIVSVEIPQLVGVKGAPKSGKILFHRNAAEQIKCLWKAWEDAGLLDLVLTWDGSWAPRLVRGRKSLSSHAFGTAFDINYPWNRMGSDGADYGEHGSVYELLPFAYKYGFFNGLFFEGRPDPMHFEVAMKW